MTQQLKQARHAASLSVGRKDLTQSSLEALVDSDTCKQGKVSGIRELLRGRSQWRQLKLLPCLIAQLSVPSGCAYLLHSHEVTFNMTIFTCHLKLKKKKVYHMSLWCISWVKAGFSRAKSKRLSIGSTALLPTVGIWLTCFEWDQQFLQSTFKFFLSGQPIPNIAEELFSICNWEVYPVHMYIISSYSLAIVL